MGSGVHGRRHRPSTARAGRRGSGGNSEMACDTSLHVECKSPRRRSLEDDTRDLQLRPANANASTGAVSKIDNRSEKMPLSRCATSFVGVMLALAASSHAQTSTTINCTDARGQAVRAVQTTTGVLAKAMTDD